MASLPVDSALMFGSVDLEQLCRDQGEWYLHSTMFQTGERVVCKLNRNQAYGLSSPLVLCENLSLGQRQLPDMAAFKTKGSCLARLLSRWSNTFGGQGPTGNNRGATLRTARNLLRIFLETHQVQTITNTQASSMPLRAASVCSQTLPTNGIHSTCFPFIIAIPPIQHLIHNATTLECVD